MSYQIKAMSFAEMLDAAFRIVRDHFVTLVGLSAAIHIPLAFLSAGIQPEPGSVDWRAAALAFIVSLAAAPIVSAALTHAVGEIYLGRPVSIGASLRAALSIVLPLAGTMLLIYLGILVGLILLVIPAIYFGVRWTLSWPVMVVERRFGTGAMRRSWDLMRGNMWRALGILVLGGIIVGVLSTTLGLVGGLLPGLGTLVGGIAQSIGLAYSSVVLVLLYFDIRCRKESFDLEHLARLVEASGPSPA